MDSVYLMGSEDVRKAASEMKQAAAEMTRAANEIRESIERYVTFTRDRDAYQKAITHG